MLNHQSFNEENNQNNSSDNSQDSSPQQETIECSHCDGTGRFQPHGARRFSRCQKCDGTGLISIVNK